jgi:hypothetical protein
MKVKIASLKEFNKTLTKEKKMLFDEASNSNN